MDRHAAGHLFNLAIVTRLVYNEGTSLQMGLREGMLKRKKKNGEEEFKSLIRESLGIRKSNQLIAIIVIIIIFEALIMFHKF